MKYARDLSREEQGVVRAHRLTASNAERLMSGSYETWNKLAAEIRRGQDFSAGTTAALRWGQETEKQARGAFWERHPEYDVVTKAFAFWRDEESELWQHVGASPDMLLMQSAQLISGCEMKCPIKPAIHQGYRDLGPHCPPAHKAQVQFQMLVTGLPYWYFVSFDPRETADAWRYHEVRVERDSEYLSEMEEKLQRFIDGYTAGKEFQPVTATAAMLMEAF